MKLILEFGLGMNCGTDTEWNWGKTEEQISSKITAPEQVAPQDMEVLSDIAGKFNGRESLSFADSREELCRSPKNGAFSMNKQWLEYFHAVPTEKTEALTEAWCKEVNEAFSGADLSTDEQLKEFVKQLKELCKQALEEEKILVQRWSFQ